MNTLLLIAILSVSAVITLTAILVASPQMTLLLIAILSVVVAIIVTSIWHEVE